MLRRTLITAVVLAAATAFPAVAGASEIIDRIASDVRLAVNGKGQALVSYRARGRRWNVLVWGAVDAIAPTQQRRQVKFRVDYSGGWGTRRRDVWKTFGSACGAYDGPPLAWLVKACKAPDGSYWALQSWQRMLPNYGVNATAREAVWELRLSHWTGELATLELELDWSYRRFHHLFGRYSYRGQAVHGFRTTRTGVPLDTFGRNIYVDTFNSAYGRGWKRENSFVAKKGTGAFCYGFYPHGSRVGRRPEGRGERYRATVIGPGVTPDVMWQGEAPGGYNSELDSIANDRQRELVGSHRDCKIN